MEKITQKQKVLEHLEVYGELTSWDAIECYGITRLSHWIYVLRHEGHVITSSTKTVKTRFGTHANIAIYHLKKSAA